MFALLAVLTVLWTPQEQASAPAADPVAMLVQALEQAAATGDQETIRELGADLESAHELAVALTTPVPGRIVIKERDRTTLRTGLRLLLEVFWERSREGRLGTWSVELESTDDQWRIARATRLAHVSGLYRLSLDSSRQLDLRDMVVRAPDLTLSIPRGTAFVAETPDGVTGIVLLGNGRMRFSPPDVAERTQVRIFSGDEALDTPFDTAFLRIRPEDFQSRFPAEHWSERPADANQLRRAQEVFEEFGSRTLHINLDDLSGHRWSIIPQAGDFIAEIHTRRHGVLTYTRSRNDAEDVTLFDRGRRRNISVYASEEKLAARGRFYNEDDLVDYDVMAYDVEVTLDPGRQTISGNARLKLKVRSAALATINLRLAEELHVGGVYSPDYGRLLHLRVVNQNGLIVNLPGPIARGSEFWLSVFYAGTLPPQTLEREAITVSQDLQPTIVLPPEPRYIYSNRSYWYPQSTVTDYATVQLKVTVPAQYDVLGTGLPTGEPAPPPGVVDDSARMMRFAFQSDRPVRYLACIVSRLRDVESRHVQTAYPPEGVMIHTRAAPRQAGRARGMSEEAAEIFTFYAGLVGDAPYPSLTLAFTERDVPGGHSPAYFAVVDQPVLPSLSWRNDPVNFDRYPAFFIAHEIAHQWWGQAVGWKNYHEQWLSEGFAQYFATLFAEHRLASGVINNILRQMRRTATRQSDQGPIYLGYRLGHVKGDPRVFRSVAYNKSAMVLHMLRMLVGDEAFFTGVRTFFREFKYRKAGTDDLLAVMEQASGQDLSSFFDAWIFGARIPEARFSYRVEKDRAILRLEQSSPAMVFPVRVRLRYRTGREEMIVMVAREPVSEHVVALTEPLRSAHANEDHGSLAEIR